MADLPYKLEGDLIYKNVGPKREQICIQYEQCGFTRFNQSFNSWEELSRTLSGLPKSEVLIVAFMDKYGKGIGKFEEHTICSDEADQFIRAKQRDINLKWSGVLHRPLEA
jgi:hypothetical protein